MHDTFETKVGKIPDQMRVSRSISYALVEFNLFVFTVLL